MFFGSRRGADRPIRVSVGVVLGFLLVAVLALPSLAVSGPTRLQDPAASPTIGSSTTVFTFSVTYRNREGSPPDYVQVVIDGQAHDMSASETNWKAGVRFTWSTTLPVGPHAVLFRAMDRERFTDEVAGPAVVVQAPAPTATPKPTAAPKATATPTPKPTTAPNANPTATPKPTVAPKATSAPNATAAPTAKSSPATATSTPPPGPATGATPTPAPSADPATGPVAGGGGPQGPAAPASQAPAGPDDPASPGATTQPLGEPGRGTPGTSGTADGPAGADGGGQGSWSTGGGWGDLATALDALGIDSGPAPELRFLPSLVTSAGVVTLALAFGFVGKRRRDGEPPDPDEVLEARAARGGQPTADGALVPAVPPSAPTASVDPELAMPRWRRPSLLQARKADPIRDAPPITNLSFAHGLVAAVDGRERRLIRYHVVELLDAPDELRGARIGTLTQGDEVQLTERSGSYWLVLCPDGQQGWIHKMTLGEVVGEGGAPTASQAWATDSLDHEEVDDDVLAAFIAARSRA